jgi:hypothetical protein
MAALSIMTSYIYHAHSLVNYAYISLLTGKSNCTSATRTTISHYYCLNDFYSPDMTTNALDNISVFI